MTAGKIWFSSMGMQVLSSIIHFTGVTILAHCLSRRVVAEQLTTIQGILQMSWARILIILVFLDSWLFMFTSGILIFGVGLETSTNVCAFGMILCIAFYATSKVLIYCFLVEKVHIVWGPITGTHRFKSPIYIFCFASMAGYVAVIVLLFVGRIGYFRESGACIIGLQHYASISVLAYDLYVNILLTALFLYPLLRAPVSNPAIRRVATRTLFASFIALSTSVVNMLVLTLMHGHQLGWVCLGSCGTDVVVNAIALFWVTSGGQQSVSSVNGRGSRDPHGPGSRTPGAKQQPIVLHSIPPSPSAARAFSLTRASGYDAEQDTKDVPFGSAVSLSPPDAGYRSPSPGARVAFSSVPTTPATPDSLASPQSADPMLREPGWRVARGQSRRGRVKNFVGLFHRSRDEREDPSLQVTVTREYVVDQEFENARDAPDSDESERGRPRYSSNSKRSKSHEIV